MRESETHPVPSPSVRASSPSLWGRLKERLPILESVLGAMILDALDVTDLPLVSWWYGIPASLLLGFWVASLFKFPFVTRIVMACMAAIYFILPGTEMVPLATIVVTAARLAGVGSIVSRFAHRSAVRR
jgi:hypothetical protein